MAFCLVKWLEEDRLSVISSSWVLRPEDISTSTLPVDGICYWKKKSSKYQTRILSVSDTKPELEQQMMKITDELENEEQEEGSKQVQTQSTQSKRPLEKDPHCVPAHITKKRKENLIANKVKKSAAIQSVNSMADEIFKKQGASVTSYTQLESQVRSMRDELRHTSLKLAERDNELADLRDKVTDQKASLAVKKIQIQDLSSEVEGLKSENELLKKKLAEARTSNIVSSTGSYPACSESSLLFLKGLVKFYTGNQRPQTTNDMDDFMVDEATSEEEDDLSDLEKTRLRNVKRNERMLVELGLKKPIQSVNKDNHQQQPTASTSTPQVENGTPETDCLRTISCGGYSYTITAHDLQREQEAFTAGEGRKELVKDFGVYMKYIDLEQCEQTSKQSATGLMRSLISVFYSNERLAACSATAGINANIRTAIFKFCEMKFEGQITSEKLKRDLTSKCGEERRKMKKMQPQ